MSSNKCTKESFLFEVLLLLLFKISLDIIFVQYTLPRFFYEPYFGRYGEFDSDRLLVGYLVLPFVWFTIRPILCSEKFSFSRTLLAFQFFLVVLPAFTVAAQGNRPIFHLVLILLGFYTLVLTMYLTRRLKIRVSLLSPYLKLGFILIFVAISTYTYAMIILTGGLDRFNFDLTEVYRIRAEYVENRFPLAGYFVPWTAHVLNISLLVYGLASSRKGLVLLALALQLFLFGTTNFKSHLFLPFAALAIYIAFRVGKLRFTKLTLLAAFSAAVLTLLEAISGGDLAISLFRRVFYVPVSIASLYFDYFSQNSFSLMSGSNIGSILNLIGVKLPYEVSAVTTIALEYWGREFSPNVGWIGAAFADFGIPGIIITAIILGFFAACGDSVARVSNRKGVAESISVGLAFSLTNSAFMTSMITHGGMITLVVLWVIASSIAETSLCRKKKEVAGDV